MQFLATIDLFINPGRRSPFSVTYLQHLPVVGFGTFNGLQNSSISIDIFGQIVVAIARQKRGMAKSWGGSIAGNLINDNPFSHRDNSRRESWA
jgi:hypothetical protein